jgi:hypothetical protein
MDQDAVTDAQGGDPVQHLVGDEVVQRHRCRPDGRRTLRARHQSLGRHAQPLQIPAGAEQRRHRLPGNHRGDSVADLLDHADDVMAGDKRWLGAAGDDPCPQQDVAIEQPRRLHTDDGLPWWG